jgi:hypothetical protein
MTRHGSGMVPPAEVEALSFAARTAEAGDASSVASSRPSRRPWLDAKERSLGVVGNHVAVSAAFLYLLVTGPSPVWH